LPLITALSVKSIKNTGNILMKHPIFGFNNHITCFQNRILWVLLLCCNSLLAQLPKTLPTLDSLTDEQVQGLCKALSQEVNLLVVAASETHATLLNQISTQEQAIEKLKQDSTADVSTLKTLNSELKNSRKEEKKHTRTKQKAVALYDEAGVLEYAEAALQRKDLPKVWEKYERLRTMLYGDTGATTPGTHAPDSGEASNASAEEKPKKGRKTPGLKPKTKKEKAPDVEENPSNASTPVPSDTAGKDKKPGKRLKFGKKESGKTEEADTPTPVAATDSENTHVVTPETRPDSIGGGGKKLKNPFRRDKDAQKETDTAVVRVPVRTAPTAKKFKSYNFLEDVLYYPPAPPCRLTLDTRDEFSGDIRRATERTELFRHTNPLLKTYLQGPELLASVQKT
jgi:hypothetical protein